jgi:hypothetical protein
MHRMGREQAASQRSLTARIEQSCELLQIDCNSLLIAVGPCGADRENAQCLRSTIEGRNEMPVDLMRGETPCFVGAEMPVCNEHGALTNGSIGDQARIDPHRDV